MIGTESLNPFSDYSPVLPQVVNPISIKAGLLTCSCFTPSQLFQSVAEVVKPIIPINMEWNLQQRVLLQIYTAFPFNFSSRFCDLKTLMAQR